MCNVCSHPHREEIENALYKMNSKNANKILAKISEEYDVSIEDLQKHALFHTSITDDPEDEMHDSIVRQIKMREADVLSAIVIDQATTVKVLGKRIRRFATSSDEEDVRFEKTLTKPMVDLYNGASDGLRKNVQTLADLNQLINGPKDDGLSGLSALAQVLAASRNRDD